MIYIAFDDETLTFPGGIEITGRVLLRVQEYDTSFIHAFGTEKQSEVDVRFVDFISDNPAIAITPDRVLEDVVDEWVTAHRKQIHNAVMRQMEDAT